MITYGVSDGACYVVSHINCGTGDQFCNMQNGIFHGILSLMNSTRKNIPYARDGVANRKSVPVTVSGSVTSAQKQTFLTIQPIDLRILFRGYLFFPAVTGVRDDPGHWDAPGLSRKPIFSDGNSAREALMTYEPFSSFSYRITDLTGPFGHVVERIVGSWVFTEIEEHSTNITWTYTFMPKRYFYGVTRFFIAPLWRRYMESALQFACMEVEKLKR